MTSQSDTEALKALLDAIRSDTALQPTVVNKSFKIADAACAAESALERLLASQGNPEAEAVAPIELFMCEIPRLTLNPGRPYIFGVDPECEECAAYLSGEDGETRAAASAVQSAIRTLRQDVRPYMRHLDDCELVKFRKSPDASAHIPPCSCGLEKVLWDLPAQTESGRTK